MPNQTPYRALIEKLKVVDNVAVIGMGGSRASGVSDEHSDFDLYVLTTGTVSHDIRADIAREFADDGVIEIGNPWWGDEDGYAIDGVWYDLAYFDADWFFSGIEVVVNQHRANLDYSTSFVFTLANMLPVHDPDGLIACWQERVTTYPDELTAAIIEANYPIVADVHASFRNQIERAISLNDAVAVNHRVAGFLACVFDIAFAVLRQWHPGEKRQLRHLEPFQNQLPMDFAEHISELLYHTAPYRLDGLLTAVDRVATDVTALVTR